MIMMGFFWGVGVAVDHTSSPRQEQKKNGQHLSRDYSPYGHENPAMGCLWGVDHH